MNKKIIVILLTVLLVTIIFSANASGVSFIRGENQNTDLQPSIKLNTVNKYALLIGAGTDYENMPCAEDVGDLSYVLTERGWNSNNINTTYIDGMATKENIFKFAIPWLAEKEDEDDIVLFYFTGHGDFGRIYDYNKENKITVSELDAAFNDFESNKVVLIFDSCRSGSLSYENNRGSELTINDLNNKHCKMLSDGLSQEGRVVIAACGANEDADYSKHPGGNSYFTFQLVCALWGYGDTNDDGWMSAEEAFYQAQEWTMKATDYEQNPEMFDGCPGEINLVYIEHSSLKHHRDYPDSFYGLIRMRLIEIQNIIFSKLRLFRNLESVILH